MMRQASGRAVLLETRLASAGYANMIKRDEFERLAEAPGKVHAQAEMSFARATAMSRRPP